MSTLFVPMERARQMWPSEMPSCQVVEGGIIVDAKTVAFAAQELMHKVYEQSKAEVATLTRELEQLRAALEKIKRALPTGDCARTIADKALSAMSARNEKETE